MFLHNNCENIICEFLSNNRKLFYIKVETTSYHLFGGSPLAFVVYNGHALGTPF